MKAQLAFDAMAEPSCVAVAPAGAIILRRSEPCCRCGVPSADEIRLGPSRLPVVRAAVGERLSQAQLAALRPYLSSHDCTADLFLVHPMASVCVQCVARIAGVMQRVRLGFLGSLGIRASGPDEYLPRGVAADLSTLQHREVVEFLGGERALIVGRVFRVGADRVLRLLPEPVSSRRSSCPACGEPRLDPREAAS